ncbi:four helix bundle protein [Candidatus Nomurabacteria bacterium]|nr:four helix bundle protein [Candidatus Nomurabacteria bacterium]
MTYSIKSYKDLIVWQKGYELVKQVYKITSKLPQAEVFALQSQMRRSAVSIVSNIAEGSSRKTRKDYCQFMHIAYGSTSELETQLFLCKDLYNIPVESQLELITEVSKMLRAIINKLEPSN